jgi:hypothetical protein
MLSLILGAKFLNLPGSESLRSLQVSHDLNHTFQAFCCNLGLHIVRPSPKPYWTFPTEPRPCLLRQATPGAPCKSTSGVG